ncbi:hypothetical protein Dimus_033843 [Dionaea muscipula]
MEEHEPTAWPDSRSSPSSWERPKADLMNKAKRQRSRMEVDLPTSPFHQTQPSSRSGFMSSSMIDPAAARHGEAPSSRGQHRIHEQAELDDMTCMENTPSSAPSFHGRVLQQAMHEAGVGHEEEASAGLKEHQQAELIKLIQGGRALLFTLKTPSSGGRSLTTFKYLSMELWELVITCHVHEVRVPRPAEHHSSKRDGGEQG